MVEAEVAARLRLIGPLGIRLGVGTAAVVTPIVLRYRDGAGQEVLRRVSRSSRGRMP